MNESRATKLKTAPKRRFQSARIDEQEEAVALNQEFLVRSLFHSHRSIVELLSTNGCVKHKSRRIGDKDGDAFLI
jgi:hypothetical protein